VKIDVKKLKARARGLKIDALALGLAVRHPQTPWYAKLMVAGLVAYVVTPVDLVPDVVPVLGIIDDLVFIPVALGLAVRFVPALVLAECRGRAAEIVASPRTQPVWRFFLVLWLLVVVVSGLWTVL
jgi:uncharacterized membrane protein YkvA (DUF1232 family)